jgi:hypothetical protein
LVDIQIQLVEAQKEVPVVEHTLVIELAATQMVEMDHCQWAWGVHFANDVHEAGQEGRGEQRSCFEEEKGYRHA